MCGIAGLVGGDARQLARMVARLAHRGPDATGSLELDGSGVLLAHTRFAILDLDSRSDQPFVSACGRWALTFNGEIYNHVELRERLVQDGALLRTSSDTEVLLHWLVRHGPEGLADLEGMYAFALCDRLARTLLLARDPVGEKPLYYALPHARGAPRFAFASEVQALLEVPGVDLELDHEALADWLRFQYTAAPRTLYRGIRELAPGHRLTIALDAPQDRPVRCADLESPSEPFAGGAAEAARAVRAALEDSVRLRLRSDVPVGLFLSAGLDSNALLAAARGVEPRTHLEAYTARWTGSREARERDESAPASEAAAHHGVLHHALTFESDRPFDATLARVLELFGQPFGNATALVTDQLAGAASRTSRVCLVGDGGDECFAGYPRHRALLGHRRLSALPAALRAVPAAIAAIVPERGRHVTDVRRARAFLRGLSQPLGEAFLEWTGYVTERDAARALGAQARSPLREELLARFERHADDPLRAAALVDLTSFVPFNLMQCADRAGMAHPLELRAPFLAPPLVALALSIPAGLKLRRGRVKPLLVDAIGDRLAPCVRERPKQPFQPPLTGWLRAHLGELEEHLCGARSRCGDVLARGFGREVVAGFRDRRRDNATLLFGLATLEMWLRQGGAAGPRSAVDSSGLPAVLPVRAVSSTAGDRRVARGAH